MDRSHHILLAICASLALAGCGKRENAPAAVASMAPAPVPSQRENPQSATTAPAPVSAASVATPPDAPPALAAPAPAPAASTDIDSPTPLPALQLKGQGIHRKLAYYYALHAGAGMLKITATAKNAPSGSTNALTVALQDAKGNALCRDTWGNTTNDKTQTLDCTVEHAQPLILRLDLSEDTIDYSVALDGPITLPAPSTAQPAGSIAGAGSTDIDAPTRLTANRIKGSGVKQAATYYYAFNAGPGDLTLTGDGRNEAAATTNALRVGLYTLRSERLCELSLGNATQDKRETAACRVDQRQPVILRVDLAPETVEWRARFDGPHDFEPFAPPKDVTIALDAAVLFETGAWALKPEARTTLHEAAERVKKFANAPVVISGHTDSVGGDAANRALSERRAAAVQDWFVGQEGIPAARLTAKGYGKTQPVADNATEQGRARNRRVEVKIGPA